MRRPNRRIEIFSMSVLDMFASALGAFIICTVILFPYYRRDVSQELLSAKAALAQTWAELDSTSEELGETEERVRRQRDEFRQAREAQTNLGQCKRDLAACQVELTKTFLMVQIEWQAQVDVDLHVTDPKGHEFFWRRTNRTGRDFPDSKAQLSIDVAAGPGIEVWVDPVAGTGRYQVDYVMRHNPNEDVSVAGSFFDRYGKHSLPAKILRNGQLRVRAGTIVIGEDGAVTLR